MQHVIYLAKSTPKCVAATHPCDVKAHCALYLVSADGRFLADYSLPVGTCMKFLAASEHRAPPLVRPPVREHWSTTS